MMRIDLDPVVAAGYAAADLGVWRPCDALELRFLALDLPGKEELDALRAAGVTKEVLATEDYFVKGARVTWRPRRRFDLGGDSRALIVAARDCVGNVIDLIAWPPARPERWARYEGQAFCLGEAAMADAALSGAVLPVVRSPVSWLAMAGRGIVILDPAEAWRRLGQVPRLAAEDLAHGRELERLIEPPRPMAEILVPRNATRRRAA